MVNKFDTNLRDSQGTTVIPLTAKQFDFGAYEDYENRLLEGNQKFAESKSGIQVYRRVRAEGVFYDKCKNMEDSLSLQLGALKHSMQYKADIANFLEPWYGIGYISACFGGQYLWLDGQAPAVKPMFGRAKEILDSNVIPLEYTEIGKHILNMTEYFMEQTKGLVPVSFCDVQAPLNMLSYLLPMTDLFMETYDDPDSIKAAAELTVDLLIPFLKKQEAIIGKALAKPGHGFASSRAFSGLGISDDNSIMLQSEDYEELFQKADERLCGEFGGLAYHSCGNWANKIDLVKGIRNIITVDGAFSIETDPVPNDPCVYANAFNGSGIVINARAVGNGERSLAVFMQLWKQCQKLIAVTYCNDQKDQSWLYDMLHHL